MGVQGYSFVQFLTIVIEGYPYGQVGFHQLHVAEAVRGKMPMFTFFIGEAHLSPEDFWQKYPKACRCLFCLLMLIVLELQFVVCSLWRVLGHNGHTLLVIQWLQRM